MTRSREESGFTLIELLVATTLFLVIMSAVLTSFNAFSNNQKRSQDLTDAQVQARVTMDRLAKELRNLASPDITHQFSIEYAPLEGNDLVFRTVSSVGPADNANPSNLVRVRYCLSGETLYRLVEQPKASQPLREINSPPASDPLIAGGCPLSSSALTLFNAGSSTISTQRVIGQQVVNTRVANRPLFTYLPTNNPTSDISQVVATIFIDVNSTTQSPGEVQLSTSAFLRNQNRKPVADIEAPTVTSSNPQHILFNGSGSIDPEGTPLTYSWTITNLNTNATATSTRAFFDFTAQPATKYSATLIVTDAANLPSDPASVNCVATLGASPPCP